MSLVDENTVRRLRLAPGDVLVVSLPTVLSPAEATRLCEQVQGAFPGRRCLVLTGGADLTVVGP